MLLISCLLKEARGSQVCVFILHWRHRGRRNAATLSGDKEDGDEDSCEDVVLGRLSTESLCHLLDQGLDDCSQIHQENISNSSSKTIFSFFSRCSVPAQ